ncbi:MAG: hypothetical protein JRJ87_27955 [Deltaproteobacteria bacterium]|nr:hypothetical protein [Deltaproteobacteria bacterium]
MYPEYKDGIIKDCKENYSPLMVLIENFLHISTWVLAGWLVWPVQLQGWPVLTIAWAGVVLVVQILLKKHNCSGCYYYGKACHLGWGKLARWIFMQDSGNLKTGMRLSLFYIVSPPLFLAAGILSGILMDLGMRHWVLVGVYVALNLLAFTVRFKGCKVCAMRKVCPGSAVKSG